MERVLIVGGGVSGLATAYFLSRYAISSTIIEKTNRTGGLIKTDHIKGCILEAGAESYIATKPAITELANELPGLRDEIVGSNDEARRIYVVKGGKLVLMPKGMVMMVPGDSDALQQSPLLSEEAKLRVLNETKMEPRERHEDFSVGDFVEEHFGPEVLEYLTEPLLCGVYGGDSENLSAPSVLPRFVNYEREFGSLVKGVRRELREKKQGSMFLSFRNGMQSLTRALAGAMAGRVNILHGEVTGLRRNGPRWDVLVDRAPLSASTVVLCTPAHVTARILETSAPPIATQLAAIPYSSAILAMLVYDAASIAHPLDGFGFLVPRGERRTIAASTWVNTKYPSRIPRGLVALRAFIVGRQAAALASASQQEVLALVREDYRRLMGITADPLFHTYYSWPDSMPQYVVGHTARVANIFNHLNDCPGLFLGGNAFDGVGTPDCVRRARQDAERICRQNV